MCDKFIELPISDYDCIPTQGYKVVLKDTESGKLYSPFTLIEYKNNEKIPELLNHDDFQYFHEILQSTNLSKSDEDKSVFDELHYVVSFRYKEKDEFDASESGFLGMSGILTSPRGICEALTRRIRTVLSSQTRFVVSVWKVELSGDRIGQARMTYEWALEPTYLSNKLHFIEEIPLDEILH